MNHYPQGERAIERLTSMQLRTLILLVAGVFASMKSNAQVYKALGGQLQANAILTDNQLAPLVGANVRVYSPIFNNTLTKPIAEIGGKVGIRYTTLDDIAFTLAANLGEAGYSGDKKNMRYRQYGVSGGISFPVGTKNALIGGDIMQTTAPDYNNPNNKKLFTNAGCIIGLQIAENLMLTAYYGSLGENCKTGGIGLGIGLGGSRLSTPDVCGY